jgi:hypothetical protein
MHKKGLTEEVAKKRSRRTVKHQRGIVGADLAAIAAKRNQTSAVRESARLAAIAKAKTEKKDKESKKAKVSLFGVVVVRGCCLIQDSLRLVHLSLRDPRSTSNRSRAARHQSPAFKTQSKRIGLPSVLSMPLYSTNLIFSHFVGIKRPRFPLLQLHIGHKKSVRENRKEEERH